MMMISKQCLLLIGGILTVSWVLAQGERILPVAQVMPTLEGCESKSEYVERRQCWVDKLDAHVARNMRYPKEAVSAGAEGIVIVRFVVDQRGVQKDHEVVEDPGYGLGEEAVRLIRRLGRWVPGSNMGEAASVLMTVPVEFRLPESGNKMADEPTIDVYDLADQMPRYQGCDQPDDIEARNCTFLNTANYMRLSMRYPEEALKQRIEGTVLTEFIIDTDGSIKHAEVLEGMGAGCDEEALRLLKEMPKWIPGMHGGKAVKVRMQLPFRFTLPKTD